MNLLSNAKTLLNAGLFVATGAFATAGFAHSGGATLGADGTNASATAMAAVTCFDDGNGEPAGLLAQIKDLSEPVPGLLLSLQLYKGIIATNVTDPMSGDASYSSEVQLNAGPGTYIMMVDKTAAGPRTFDVIWHCMTADNVHTGTDIVVRQFQ